MTKAVKWLIIGMLGAVFVYMGYLGATVIKFSMNIKTDSLSDRFANLKDQPVAFQPPSWSGEERVNVLIMGGDARGLKPGEIPRSDTLLLASMDPQSKKAALFSIMRDTYTEIPGHREDRINVALSKGGPKLAMETVGQLLGIPVQYYVYTDFQGFIELVNAIGGVQIDVPKDMDYVDSADGNQFDIHLKKGLQTLDGDRALQYVRFRHDAQSDFARTGRQREFLSALTEKLKSSTSIMKLPTILSKVQPYVETNMSFSEILKLGGLAYQTNTQTIPGYQIPPMELVRETTRRGAAVLEADDEALKRYVQEAFVK